MGSERFPRAARLLAKAQFDAVFASPLRQQSPLFRVHALRAASGGARLGLAVTKRIAPLASERNRLRRHAREAFRRERATLPALDIVLVAKPTAVGQPANALRSDLARVFAQLRALNPAQAPGTIGAPAVVGPSPTRPS